MSLGLGAGIGRQAGAVRKHLKLQIDFPKFVGGLFETRFREWRSGDICRSAYYFGTLGSNL